MPTTGDDSAASVGLPRKRASPKGRTPPPGKRVPRAGEAKKLPAPMVSATATSATHLRNEPLHGRKDRLRRPLPEGGILQQPGIGGVAHVAGLDEHLRNRRE